MTRTRKSANASDKSEGGEAGKSDKPKSRSAPKPARTGEDFGLEGTNKTVPVPKQDGAPSEELGNTPHIEKTPYTRG